MLIVLAVFLTVTGLFFTYITVGLARSAEKRRGYEECEKRLSLLRRQLLKRPNT
jgi:hypothetical protein